MLLLYTTLGCHLCEDARSVLWPIVEKYGLTLSEIEIADSDELIELYGVRIPVIKLKNSEADLGWPFDQSTAENYLLENIYL
jgi:hypothetical protein